MDKKKSFMQLSWDAMLNEFFKRHPEAGLAWWDLPIEQQPSGFKEEMYDIFWDLMNNIQSKKQE